MTEEERKAIEDDVESQVTAAVEFADSDDQPDPSGLFDYLYVDPPDDV
jgi:TPP-dependent pyruvate/acetoin dehydrogenase alpha subunit